MSEIELPPLDPVPSMTLDQFYEGERAVSVMACQNYAKLYAQAAILAERERCARVCDGLKVAAASYFEINERLDEAAAAIRHG